MRTTLGLRSKALISAFANVPREAFVGPGPWLISDGEGYRLTPDADASQLYANVLVALDGERELNNGRPGTHAPWLEALAPLPGEHVVHVGAGAGYYTAILAALVGLSGRVTAIEIEPALIAQLRRNVLWLKRVSDDCEARFLSAKPDIRMYPCQDGRSTLAEGLLARAFARGGFSEVRSVRRAKHAEEAHCWLHGADFCLSRVGLV
jgi:hypothetical protein